jgi:hypothetical protein
MLRQCFDETGLPGGILQGPAKPPDRIVHAMLELDNGAIRPKPPAEFVASDYIARSLQQETENLDRLIGNTHPNVAFA